MKDWFDKEQVWCLSCKHKWILTSDKQITQNQHNIWFKYGTKQHKEIHEKL